MFMEHLYVGGTTPDAGEIARRKRVKPHPQELSLQQAESSNECYYMICALKKSSKQRGNVKRDGETAALA